jgi:hypothetical protein
MTEAARRTPFIGQTVHYQSYGTPGGEYLPAPRAAIVTEVEFAVDTDAVGKFEECSVELGDGEAWAVSPAGARVRMSELPTKPVVGLCVLNPTGMFFNQGVPFAEEPTPGHWNFMPRTEAGDAVSALVDDVCRIAGWSGETAKEA